MGRAQRIAPYVMPDNQPAPAGSIVLWTDCMPRLFTVEYRLPEFMQRNLLRPTRGGPEAGRAQRIAPEVFKAAQEKIE